MNSKRNACLSSVAFLLIASASAVQALPTLTIDSASGPAGTAVNVPVTFDPSTSPVAGIQFSITLPASLSSGTVTPGAILNAAGKSVSTNLIGNSWTFIIFGLNQTTISSGTLLTAQMVIAPGTALGTLSLPVTGIIYSDANGNAVPAGTSTAGSVAVVPPIPVIASSSTATGQVGVAFSYQITATNSPTSFNAAPLPAGLSINTATGLISGTPTSSGTTSITLSATNAGGTGTTTLSLTILPQAPMITSTGTATGQVGVAFSYQITATNIPTSFNAAPLPAGLSINTATGLISGTPTSSGTTSITLSATNAGGTGTKTLALTINPATPVITSSATVTGQVGVAFSYQITATNSPTSFNATGLPAGLSVNTANGLISGAPTASGTSSVSLSATNAGGTGTATLTLTILPAAPVITNPNTASGKQWSNFLYQIVATNSPTSYSALGLPAGLVISTTTGQITGAPQGAGTSIMTLAATNAGGTGTLALTLTVLPACDVNSDGLTNVLDIQLEVNMALGTAACTSDINRDGSCNVLDIQRIVNNALGGACVSP